MNQETNMNRTLHAVAAVVVVSMAAGCAVAPPAQPAPAGGSYGNAAIHYGYVQDINLVRDDSQTSGGGAVLGGVVGGVLGNQVGKGTGRSAATVVGVVGGALIGNEIEKNRRGGGQDVYRIVLRLDNGTTRSIDVTQQGDLRVGDRVRVQDNRITRL